jgi:glycerophosphoryl diester phosphodiesterase
MLPEIIAHRGASHDAPENTLAAIQLAWKQKADAVEIDVQLSQDGHLVVIHDSDTGKTGRVRKPVADQTLVELRRLDVGSWRGEQWAGERIPTLREALAAVPPGKRIYVELKCGPESLPAFALDVRASGLKSNQVVPIGFSLPTMRAVKLALPELEAGWVVSFRRTLHGWSPKVERLLEQALAANLDALDVDQRGPANAKFARAVHDARLKLYTWTVDSPAKAKQLAAAGLDGLTTNRPSWLRERLVVGSR